MRCSSIGHYWIRWFIGSLVVFSSSTHSFGGIDLEVCLDSLIHVAKSYDALVTYASNQNPPEADFSIPFPILRAPVQREEAILDSLANRLKSEECQPYNFETLETLWCKGFSITGQDTECHHSIYSLEDTATANESMEFIEPVVIRDAVALQSIFGSSILSNSPRITDEEYALMAIQKWELIHTQAAQSWKVIQSQWIRFRSINDIQLHEFAKSMLTTFRLARR